jgi:hypothetical protein
MVAKSVRHQAHVAWARPGVGNAAEGAFGPDLLAPLRESDLDSSPAFVVSIVVSSSLRVGGSLGTNDDSRN